MKNNVKSTLLRILNEELEKRSSQVRVPEVTKGSDYKKIIPHSEDTMTKEELLADISKVVADINKEYVVGWDDHDDISIHAGDMFKVRIIPKWENNYCVEIFVKNEDRLYITGQSWEQVKTIIKDNLKKTPTTATKAAYDKSIDNLKRDDTGKSASGLPQKDKPKTLPSTDTEPSTEKNKEKNYTEKQVKNEEDLPEKPMREVGEIKRQADHKVKDPVKLKKKSPDKKLVVKQK